LLGQEEFGVEDRLPTVPWEIVALVVGCSLKDGNMKDHVHRQDLLCSVHALSFYYYGCPATSDLNTQAKVVCTSRLKSKTSQRQDM
jgi:hypothetical protein